MSLPPRVSPEAFTMNENGAGFLVSHPLTKKPLFQVNRKQQPEGKTYYLFKFFEKNIPEGERGKLAGGFEIIRLMCQMCSFGLFSFDEMMEKSAAKGIGQYDIEIQNYATGQMERFGIVSKIEMTK